MPGYGGAGVEVEVLRGTIGGIYRPLALVFVILRVLPLCLSLHEFSFI
jgi:hypothetical protein